MKLLLQVLVILLLGAVLGYFALYRTGAGDGQEPEVVLTPAEQALRLAETRGCLACHTLDGSAGVGPSWLGSWGQIRSFTDGSAALVDEDYLRESMQSPGARIVEGYDKLMLPAGFTEEELQLIINLIRNMTVTPAE